mmetsp:Transcript_40134/g.71188  ORF Transcript_40134/g.71188 Transcript_40134/m.71188 type:complete len:228 (+) Transcript_40134:113-796(+)
MSLNSLTSPMPCISEAILDNPARAILYTVEMPLLPALPFPFTPARQYNKHTTPVTKKSTTGRSASHGPISGEKISSTASYKLARIDPQACSSSTQAAARMIARTDTMIASGAKLRASSAPRRTGGSCGLAISLRRLTGLAMSAIKFARPFDFTSNTKSFLSPLDAPSLSVRATVIRGRGMRLYEDETRGLRVDVTGGAMVGCSCSRKARVDARWASSWGPPRNQPGA